MRMLRRFLGLCFLITFTLPMFAGDVIVYFKDKGSNAIKNPNDYLGEKAIQRRIQNAIPTDASDLPVENFYIQNLVSDGYTISGISKWLNAVYISNITKEGTEHLRQKYFVKYIQKMKGSRSVSSAISDRNNRYPCEGFSLPQRDMLEVDRLHVNGITGKGMTICVMDDGFMNVQQIPGFQHLYTSNRITGTKNLLTGKDDVYWVGGHGTAVLSNIAGYISGELHGTGFGANFLLARTELDSIESPLEMFLWAMAAEWADSAGADILSTSLGYSQFDDPTTDYYYADMDGKTTIISKAASIAVTKGLLVINSAGNEGTKPWKYICAPADVDGVITVGAVDSKENIADFSSRGPTWDGRMKPDLCCQGVSNKSIGPSGDIYYPSGTSFSCPTMSGFAACIKQINPNLTTAQIKNYIYESCSNKNNPDNNIGRGVPRGASIYQAITEKILPPLSSCDFLNIDGIYIYPNPAAADIYIMFDNRNHYQQINIQLIDITGKTFKQEQKDAQQGLQQFHLDVSNSQMPKGLYYILIFNEEGYILTEQKVIVI